MTLNGRVMKNGSVFGQSLSLRSFAIVSCRVTSIIHMPFLSGPDGYCLMGFLSLTVGSLHHAHPISQWLSMVGDPNKATPGNGAKQRRIAGG